MFLEAAANLILDDIDVVSRPMHHKHNVHPLMVITIDEWISLMRPASIPVFVCVKVESNESMAKFQLFNKYIFVGILLILQSLHLHIIEQDLFSNHSDNGAQLAQYFPCSLDNNVGAGSFYFFLLQAWNICQGATLLPPACCYQPR